MAKIYDYDTDTASYIRITEGFYQSDWNQPLTRYRFYFVARQNKIGSMLRAGSNQTRRISEAHILAIVLLLSFFRWYSYFFLNRSRFLYLKQNNVQINLGPGQFSMTD